MWLRLGLGLGNMWIAGVYWCRAVVDGEEASCSNFARYFLGLDFSYFEIVNSQCRRNGRRGQGPSACTVRRSYRSVESRVWGFFASLKNDSP
jgi:hypothetical protein